MPVTTPVNDNKVPLIVGNPVYNNTVIQITKVKTEVTDPQQVKIMIAAMCVVVVLVLISVGIFIYYKKCTKTTDTDGASAVPNTSVSNTIAGVSSSKVEDVYED